MIFSLQPNFLLHLIRVAIFPEVTPRLNCVNEMLKNCFQNAPKLVQTCQGVIKLGKQTFPKLSNHSLKLFYYSGRKYLGQKSCGFYNRWCRQYADILTQKVTSRNIRVLLKCFVTGYLVT